MRTIIANRNLQSQNVKINKILEVYRWIRQANEIYSQDVPQISEIITQNQERIQLFREKLGYLNPENKKSEILPFQQNSARP